MKCGYGYISFAGRGFQYIHFRLPLVYVIRLFPYAFGNKSRIVLFFGNETGRIHVLDDSVHPVLQVA